MKVSQPRCEESAVRYPGRWPRYHQCYRKGVVNEEGKLWCKQHAPSSIQAQQQASTQLWQKNHDARMASHNEANRLRAVNAKLLEALEEVVAAIAPTTLGTNELSMIFRRARAAIKEAKE